jgi:hypothetical protein
MTLPMVSPLILALIAQAAPDAAKDDQAGARLEFMMASVAGYEIAPTDDPKATFRLRPEPVLRFTNTVGASRDGAVFLWHDGVGRPAVALQVMVLRGGGWVHELSSLSTSPLVARSPILPPWTPARGGVELRPVPGAPKPAATAEQRLAQMGALARQFSAEDHFRGESWQRLRLLSKPFARYGKQGSAVVDGALFCFVLTTDPEVYLMLEARQGTDHDGPAWHYAFAPSTVYAVRGLWQGKNVWELGVRFGEGPEATFINRGIPSDGAPREPGASTNYGPPVFSR